MKIKRALAALLVLLTLPAAGAEEEGGGTATQEFTVSKGAGISTSVDSASLAPGGKVEIKITSVPVGYELRITIAENSFQKGDTESKTFGGDNGYTASVNWQANSNLATINISAAANAQPSRDKITIAVEGEEKNYTVTASGSNTSSGGLGSFGSGATGTLATIEPNKGYELKSLTLEYNGTNSTVTSTGVYQGLNVTFGASSATVKGPIYNDLNITATAEEIKATHQVRVYLEDGLELTRGSSSQTVDEGGSVMIRVAAKSGYRFDSLTCQYGKNYASWAPGQQYLMMGTQRIRVTESSDGGTVSFTIYDIYTDIELDFAAAYDEENLPVTVNEGTRINIDADCGDTVRIGDDIEFRIWTTSDRYEVNKITLKIGSSSASVDPRDKDTIRVGGRSYDVTTDRDGEVTVYVDKVRDPVTLSATSTGSSAVSRPTITISSSSNMTITKNVSGTRIDAGDDVTFYFTPNTRYQIDEITVQIGNSSRTVSASKTSISVGGETYDMYRDANGRVTLYLTDIEANVKVSGKAYYSNEAPEATKTLRMNTSSREAFLNGYSDGTFHPAAFMTRAEAATMLYRLTTGTASTANSGQFYDVISSSWYSAAVCALADAGIVDSGGYFRPDNNITRAELCEMLYRLSGSPATSGSDFSDTRYHRSAAAIRYCRSRGWIDGYPGGAFRPDVSITRSEVAAMMTRVLGRSGSSYGGSSYRDVPSSHWAYRYISLASSYY